MKKALVFGTGMIARQCYSDIIQKYRIIGFIDNDVSKCGKPSGIDERMLVFSPGQIIEIDPDVVVIASRKGFFEIHAQLRTMGIGFDRIDISFVCSNRKVYLKDFIKMQIDSCGNMKRMDMIVRYLAIKSYIQNEPEGIRLYKEMQRKRLGCSEADAERFWERFRELIDSIKRNGFCSDYPIICDGNLNVFDGSHRAAACWYFGVRKIPLMVLDDCFDIDYSMDWFWTSGFDRNDIDYLIEMKNKLLLSGDSIVGFIWPVGEGLVRDIKSDLASMTRIKESRSFEGLDESEFARIIRAIYSTDNIASWKIDKKIDYLKHSNRGIEMLKVELDLPDYRIKTCSGLPISEMAERIKKMIRGRYKKRLDDYFYDIIFHMADNYYQTDVIDKILSLSCDLTHFFDQICDAEYAVIKTDVPYMPEDFPRHYAVGKDIDIICLEESFNQIKTSAKEFANTYAAQNELDVRIIDGNNNSRIRIEYLDALIIQFDIGYRINNLNDAFCVGALQSRVLSSNAKYYVLDIEDELIVRLNECQTHPEKEHHFVFVERMKSKINKKKAINAMMDTSRIEEFLYENKR